MDAHFFRILANELCALLQGARLEKIHGPLPGLLVFTLFAQGVKRRLFFRFERQEPLLFFSQERLPNPQRPSAAVMRLRKYCAGRRLGKGEADFVTRRVLFALPGAPDVPETENGGYLLLDMVNGAFVTRERPEDFALAPDWPDSDAVSLLCGKDWKGGQSDGDFWRRYAVLTPLLRETLAALPPEEGRALLVDLEAGGGDVFLYADAQGRPVAPLAWPLPEAPRRRRGLCAALPLAAAGDAVFLPWLGRASEAASLLPEYPALAAACLAWEKSFFAGYAADAGRAAAKPLRRADKKREKLLAKLAREEERLRAMLALRQDAIALQGELWRFGPEEKHAEIRLEGQDGRLLCLDPRFTVRGNMARMFKESARGARGLAMLAERRAAIAAHAPFPAREPEQPGKAGAFATADPGQAQGARPAPPAPSGPSALSGPDKDIPGVARFVSSDGFVILRGKNAGGNQRLLKIGSGHDLWLHAEQGPSAHAIIRRSHGAQEVPESTLREAGALVAAKSRYRDDAAADVMVALLRHVHGIKGAAPGTVRVDAVLQSIRVAPAREGGQQEEE